MPELEARNLDPAPGEAPVNELARSEYAHHPELLARAFSACRLRTLELAGPLSAEDQMLQSMPDASPTKWHLAHTSWFFETFVLEPWEPGFRCFQAGFRELFNSYYNGIGAQFPRPDRGLISRPSLDQVLHYRTELDERVVELLTSCAAHDLAAIAPLLVLGINHEQQHQELILTDIKHALFRNPQHPAYCQAPAGLPNATPLQWQRIDTGKGWIGYHGRGFAFDNEVPRHEVLVNPFELGSRQVCNGEWLEFIEAGGYQNPMIWLSDGWAWKQENRIRGPLYWSQQSGQWHQFTLAGLQALQAHAPVGHVSYYEADAFARWSGARLPTEFEWELAAANLPGNKPGEGLGPLESIIDYSPNWQWTSSAYQPYPGFNNAPGAIGEYNGKFMVNQLVLRGGSGATPPGHYRHSYRNFFHPGARWQFSGLRLARDG